MTRVAIHQLQAGHHTGLGQGVQRPAFSAVQLDAAGGRTEQDGDDTVLAGIATNLAPVAIHNHVGLPLTGDLVTADARPRHRQFEMASLGPLLSCEDASADPPDPGDVTPRDSGHFDDIATLRRIDVETVADVDTDVAHRPVQRDEIAG